MDTTTTPATVQAWPASEARQLQAVARRMLSDHGHSLGDFTRLTRESCGACALAGYVSRDTRAIAKADGETISGPNYAGWARVYVQAGRAIPRKWRAAFEAELARDDNPAYTNALARDIATFGVRHGW